MIAKHVLAAAAIATAALTSPVKAAPVQWTVASGGNGHWYELVTVRGFRSFGGAKRFAEGLVFKGVQGHLATITSQQEQDFVNSVNSGFDVAWLGGSDRRREGVWRWVTGPEAGIPFTYTNWVPGEPNNAGGNENGLLGWWAGDQWNDIFNGAGRFFALVEYSTPLAPIPLPASGLLVVGALGGLVLLRRRRA
jgi:hypothetical protein